MLPHTTHILDNIYVGKARAAYASDQLRQAGLTHILQLYQAPPGWPADFVVCHNELEDGIFIPREILQKGVEFLQRCAAANQPVLSVCGAGQSRSVTFVLAYMLEKGYDLKDAWLLMQQQHPDALPNPCFWQTLLHHYKTPYQLTDALSWSFK